MDLKLEYLRLLNIVKSKLKETNQPARNEDIANTLAYTRTSFQNLISEKGVVTEEHIKLLKLHYPFLSENVTINLDPWVIVSEMVQANNKHADANNKNADANKENSAANRIHADSINRLVVLLEQKLSSGKGGKVSSPGRRAGKGNPDGTVVLPLSGKRKQP